MNQNPSVPFTIRELRPSDGLWVESLFRDAVLEHVYPAFFRALGHPDHVGVALSVSMAGYVLGGSSYLQGFLFLAGWAGLLYYCCHEIYAGYLARRLGSDMAEAGASYRDNPDCGCWVAEAEGAELVGVVAVTGKRGEEEGERFVDWNGGVLEGGSEFGEEAADGGHGEVALLAVAFPWRRRKLGAALLQTAVDFCRERGFARLVLDVSSPQAAAAALYQQAGFLQTAAHSNTHANRWLARLARIQVARMEKVL